MLLLVSFPFQNKADTASREEGGDENNKELLILERRLTSKSIRALSGNSIKAEERA